MDTNEQPDAFRGIPMLGPTRRARLLAAGLLDAASLSRASVEEIARIAQMPRGQAERVREAASLLTSEPPITAATVPLDTPETAVTAPATRAEPPGTDPLYTALARSRAAVDAALADRNVVRRLGRDLARLSGTLERLAAVESVRLVEPEQRADVARLLERAAVRLERAVSPEGGGLTGSASRLLAERLDAIRNRLRKSLRPSWQTGAARGGR
jgi:Nuclease subunit of the excinuclease complex